METRLPIEELVSKVLSELERLNYANNTICGYRAFYKRVIAFAKERNKIFFSEALGREFLKEKYECTTDYYKEAMPKGLKDHIRRIRVLGDYQLHGVIIRRIVKKKGYVKPPQFEEELTAYERECENNEYSKRGMRTRMQRLFFFIDYLDSRKVQKPNDITPEIISDYVKTIYKNHEKSIASILTTLRVYLRFLYFNQYTDENLSLKVQNRISIIIRKDYYDAVFEAAKGLAERVRNITGLRTDGSALFQTAFAKNDPYIFFNKLSTPSEKSEFTGPKELLEAIFHLVRNPAAHTPKVNWRIDETKALDILTVISFAHKYLDECHRMPNKL